MKATYFWDGEKVIVEPRKLLATEVKEMGCLYMHCVDEFRTGNSNRYGRFTNEPGWDHIPLEEFPPEFRVTLLLMGIT